MIDELVTKMVEAGVHLGHQSRKWHPNMKKYILTQKNGIHIVNVEETEKCLDKACAFLSDLAAKNKKILFVGCKRQAQDAVREAAEACGQFYVNFRWLGGMLTNMATVKKSVARLDYLENLDKQPEYKQMSKKEIAALSREREKLLKNLQGIRGMGGAPDVMVVIGADHEDIAVREAHILGIPVIALTDTNTDPESVEFPIPGNDDAVRSIRLILSVLVEAITKAAPAQA
ncbi:MAG: 30S ribosomal protein S2 [Akkermansia sp.]